MMTQPTQGIANRLLGYPDDARLLVINADDLGMYAAINEAVVRAFAEGIVCSTSLMTPCPGAAEAMALLKAHPEIDFGVHLSFVRDIEDYHWGPVAPRERVPSLLAADGDFYTMEQRDELLAAARLDELETEFRAQIETVLAAGLTPTHLDWHCLHNGGRDDIFGLTLDLAREYGLAVRVGADYRDQVQTRGLPANDHEVLDSFRLEIATKADRYAELLRNLPPGLTEWAVHPGLDTPAARSVDPEGWEVRDTDRAFVVSTPAREIIAEEGITLIGYRELQVKWRERFA